VLVGNGGFCRGTRVPVITTEYSRRTVRGQTRSGESIEKTADCGLVVLQASTAVDACQVPRRSWGQIRLTGRNSLFRVKLESISVVLAAERR
jgi:hypothetical protein